MKIITRCVFGTLLILLIVGCSSQSIVGTQQILSTSTVTASPTVTLPPTTHPFAITVENASSLKLEKIIGSGRVNDVAWSPHGDVIAVAQDFDISFFDSITLQVKEKIGFGGKEIVFSPDGLFLAIAKDKQIILWDILNKTINQEITIDMARVDQVVYNSTGTSLAVLGDSRITEGDPPSVLELWDTRSWERVYSNREKFEANMAFSPDGETLAFISNADLLLINSATGNPQKIDLTWGNGSLVYINDDIILKQYDHGQLTLMNLRTSENLNFINIEIGYHSGFRLSPDKRKIVFPENWDDEKNLWITQVWDLETEKLLYTLEFSSDVTRVDFSPDGKYFISADKDGYIRIHDFETGNTVKQMDFTAQVEDVDFVSTDKFIAGYYQGQVRLWSLNTSEVAGIFEGNTDWDNVVSVSPDQNLIATKQDSYVWRVWEIETGSLISTISCPDKESVNNLLFAKGNKTILIECRNSSNKSSIIAWDIDSQGQTFMGSGSMLEKLPLENSLIMLSNSNVRSPFYIADIPSVQIVDVYEKNTLFNVTFDEDLYYIYISDMAVSSDSEILALLVHNSVALIWNVNSDRYKYSFVGHDSETPYNISDITFSPYGYLLASAGYDNTVRLWDASAGKQLVVLDDFAAPVNSVAFSPDGRYLIAGCHDGRIYVYAIE